ncbi:MAG: FAD-binding protein [Deltaproteobacteria bacterium]|nr:FAD-binding protein [Deltaproteobacteria bacterium]
MEKEYGTVTTQIIEEIQEIVEAKNVIFEDKEKLENYAADEAGEIYGHMPEVVVKPDSTEQVSKIMKLANKNKITVTPRAAGSGIAGAAVPLFGGIVLSVERMNKILEIDKVNRVAVVEAGVITNELCLKVLEEGLMYAGYPMSIETSFISGNVATNAGGGKVIKYGNTRRHILGLEVVLPTGEVIELGGKFRKDTWGYNLLNLMIGSEGTLGIFTKVIVNLVSSADKTVDLLVPFGDVETAVNAVADVIVTGGVLPVAVEFMDKLSVDLTTKYLNTKVAFQDQAEAYLIIQLDSESREGLENLYEKVGEICLNNDALDVFVAESRTDSENIWKVRQEFAEGIRAADPYASLSGDVVVPLSKVPEMMKEIKRIGEKYNMRIPTAAHIADGNLHPELMKPENVSVQEWPKRAEEIYEEMTEVAIKFGGAGSGEHGIGFIKKPIFLKTKSEAELNLMRGIKKVFDPNYILNPGKII